MALATSTAPGAYATLLARSLAGGLAPEALDALCDTLDEAPASADERRAFARFYLDLLAAGDEQPALPTADEMADVLTLVRA